MEQVASDTVSIRELQKVELDILDSIDKFCRSHNIHYSLAFGTMLGAVRHKGFIPWDDDVDIVMPRDDYERFLNEFSSGHLIIKSVEIDKEWPFPFAKVFDMKIELNEHIHGCEPYGAYVDVFPLDGLPNNFRKIKKIYAKVVRRWFIIARSFTESRHSSKNIFRKIARFIIISICWFLRKPLIKKMVKSSKKYDFNDSKYVGCQSIGTYGLKHAVEKEKLGYYSDIYFENHYYMCFSGFDYYLSHIYGDYMKIPPESDRITHTHDLKWRK